MNLEAGDIVTGSILPEPMKMLACRFISPALTKIGGIGFSSEKCYGTIVFREK